MSVQVTELLCRLLLHLFLRSKFISQASINYRLSHRSTSCKVSSVLLYALHILTAEQWSKPCKDIAAFPRYFITLSQGRSASNERTSIVRAGPAANQVLSHPSKRARSLQRLFSPVKSFDLTSSYLTALLIRMPLRQPMSNFTLKPSKRRQHATPSPTLLP